MRSARVRSHAALPLVVVASLGLSLSLWAQTQRPSPPVQPPAPHDRVEAAHEDLRRTMDDRAREVGSLTNEIAGALPPDAGPPGPLPRHTFIDRLVFDRIERDHVPHAGLASDGEFVRRAYFDALGMPPRPDEVQAFVADSDPAKRAKLVDRLLARDEFAEQWAWYWGDLLRMGSEAGPGSAAFHFWLKEQLAADRPYDQLVHDVLTPSAKVHATVPSLALIGRNNQLKSRMVEGVDDYRIHNRLDAIDSLTIDVGRVFLGLNISCISCHDGAGHLEAVNSYLSQRKRAEFFSQAAFFGTTRMVGNWNDKSRNVDRDLQVDDLAKGYDTGDDAPYLTVSESQYPRPKGVHEPAFLLTGEQPRPGVNPRAELARMVTSHPQFARATVNIVWGRLMSLGFVEPYDGFDMDRLTPGNSQATNLELLEALAADFRDHGFRLQHVVRTIMNSSAYQLSTRFPGEWNDKYLSYYPRKYVRVLSGPEVVDAVSAVTGVPFAFTLGGESFSRVKALTSPGDVGRKGEGLTVDSLMQSFFQSNRRTPAPVANKASTLQALLMMRSTVVNDRVLVGANGTVGALVKSPRSNAEIVDALFLATLGRTSRPEETRVALLTLDEDRASGAENLQWVLLNSPEFLVNH